MKKRPPEELLQALCQKDKKRVWDFLEEQPLPTLPESDMCRVLQLFIEPFSPSANKDEAVCPLRLALRIQRPDLLRMLLIAGADVERVFGGQKALDELTDARSAYADNVCMRVEALSYFPASSLHSSHLLCNVLRTQDEIRDLVVLRFLILAKANVHDDAPVQIAAKQNHPRMLRVLMEAGASVFAQRCCYLEEQTTLRTIILHHFRTLAVVADEMMRFPWDETNYWEWNETADLLLSAGRWGLSCWVRGQPVCAFFDTRYRALLDDCLFGCLPVLGKIADLARLVRQYVGNRNWLMPFQEALKASYF